MPIVASSPSTRTHSWSVVYRRSVGTMPVGAPLASALALVEGQRHDLGGHALLANMNVEHRTRRRVDGSDVRHGDRLAERRRLRAARDDSGLALPGRNGIAVTGDAAAGDGQTDEALRGSLARHSLEGGAA